MGTRLIKAGEDLTGKEGLAIVSDDSGEAVLPATYPSGEFAGVLTTGAGVGLDVEVTVWGGCDAIAAIPFAPGKGLTYDTAGKFRPAQASQYVAGDSLTSAEEADATFSFEVTHAGYAQGPVDEDGVPKWTAKSPNARGNQRVETEPRESGDGATKFEAFSPNFCDRRSWYPGSSRETGVTLSTSDNLTFTQPTPGPIIDVTHGRNTNEPELSSYAPVVYVDGTPKTEHSPDSTFSYDASGDEVHSFADGDGDFGIDYSTGAVTFKTSQTGTVTIDQSRAGNSNWGISPETGKILTISKAKLQFSDDAVIAKSFLFSILVSGQPVNVRTYKTKADLLRESTGQVVEINADPEKTGGGWSWRANPHPQSIYRWEYIEQACIKLTEGMELRLSIDTDEAASGHEASVSFFGLSRDADS